MTRTTTAVGLGFVVAVAAVSVLVSAGERKAETLAAGVRIHAAPPVVVTEYPVRAPVGLMVTTGGWAYCEQARPIATATRHTLLCGAYARDGYVGPGLRSRRRLDWGNERYLRSFAAAIAAARRRTPGPLVLIGASYAGFGVATLAAHHPELRPDRLIVIDAYLDLVARRRALPERHETAVEIDREAGTSASSLRARSADAAALARLVRSGTTITAVWSVSDEERRFFRGATCGREATAATLARLADLLGRPVAASITRARHGVTLWRHGAEIVEGRVPGRVVVFRPGRGIPPASVCRR